MFFEKYIDDFEDASLDLSKWHARQVPDKERQISFSSDAASGNQSIMIHVTDGDGGVSCNNCQRAEVRTHGSLRPLHDDEFWHAFSFKASGDIPSTGSIRTVLGQWKAPGDGSPFLAQRFDNGVFHITIQDGPNRRTVASAIGDPDRLDAFQDLVAELSSQAPELLHSSRALSELKLFRNAAQKFDAVQESGFAENLVQAAESLSDATVTKTQELFDEFAFVHEIDSYAHKPRLVTKRHGPKRLPDPKQNWVRMAYRIKAGRRDNDTRYGPQREGEVDIYANGDLIAEVRGDIGYQLQSEPSHRDVYFKFGVYWDRIPGTLNFHFDKFAQGRSLSDVV